MHLDELPAKTRTFPGRGNRRYLGGSAGKHGRGSTTIWDYTIHVETPPTRSHVVDEHELGLAQNYLSTVAPESAAAFLLDCTQNLLSATLQVTARSPEAAVEDARKLFARALAAAGAKHLTVVARA
jgi:hypothetical protein